MRPITLLLCLFALALASHPDPTNKPRIIRGIKDRNNNDDGSNQPRKPVNNDGFLWTMWSRFANWMWPVSKKQQDNSYGSFSSQEDTVSEIDINSSPSSSLSGSDDEKDKAGRKDTIQKHQGYREAMDINDSQMKQDTLPAKVKPIKGNNVEEEEEEAKLELEETADIDFGEPPQEKPFDTFGTDESQAIVPEMEGGLLFNSFINDVTKS